jgi:hypothetical protein
MNRVPEGFQPSRKKYRLVRPWVAVHR